MNRLGMVLAAAILAGCAMTPEQSQRLQDALGAMTQASNDQYARNMALNQQMAAQRNPYAAQMVSTTPQMMVLPGTLKNQSVNGSLRYCTYSNGVVTTVASISLCPMSTQ